MDARTEEIRARVEKRIPEFIVPDDVTHLLTELTALREEVERLEATLREEWWHNHGGHGFAALYGDDGEMTCNRCMTDFKRMPFDELRQRVFELRLKAASDAVAALSPSPAQQEHNES